MSRDTATSALQMFTDELQTKSVICESTDIKSIFNTFFMLFLKILNEEQKYICRNHKQLRVNLARR